jgi:hypothetical protein
MILAPSVTHDDCHTTIKNFSATKIFLYKKDASLPLCFVSGIAVGVDGKVFIADGTNIRQVDENGIITTLIGNQVTISSNIFRNIKLERFSVFTYKYNACLYKFHQTSLVFVRKRNIVYDTKTN